MSFLCVLYFVFGTHCANLHESWIWFTWNVRVAHTTYSNRCWHPTKHFTEVISSINAWFVSANQYLLHSIECEAASAMKGQSLSVELGCTWKGEMSKKVTRDMLAVVSTGDVGFVVFRTEIPNLKYKKKPCLCSCFCHRCWPLFLVP